MTLINNNQIIIFYLGQNDHLRYHSHIEPLGYMNIRGFFRLSKGTESDKPVQETHPPHSAVSNGWAGLMLAVWAELK